MSALAIVKTSSAFAFGGVMALFSPTDVKEIIIAVGVFVAGVGVVAVNVINARAQSRKLDAQGAKIDVIEGHVNSEKTELNGKIAALRQEVALLREVMADKKETAALLAQSQSQPVAVVLPVLPSAAVTKEPAILKSIDKHVEDTANNTARTEANVKDLKEKQ